MPRFLLRSAAGELIGLYPRRREPMRLYAAPLVRQSAARFTRSRKWTSSMWALRWVLPMLRHLLARVVRALDLVGLFNLPRGTAIG